MSLNIKDPPWSKEVLKAMYMLQATARANVHTMVQAQWTACGVLLKLATQQMILPIRQQVLTNMPYPSGTT